MKRLPALLAAACLISLPVPSSAAGAFGFTAESAFVDSAGGAEIEAGTHPFEFVTNLEFNTVMEGGKEISDGEFRDFTINAPAGLVGDPRAVPRCPGADFLNTAKFEYGECPDSTAIGGVTVRAPGEVGGDPAAIFNLVPPPGAVGKIGFNVLHVPVTIELRLSTEPPYNVIALQRNISNQVEVGGAEATLWGNPASAVHDSERGKCFQAAGSCPVSIPERPFITLPRSCTGPLETIFEGVSWKGDFAEHKSSVAGMGECAKLLFSPELSAQPTTAQAESPSGLDVDFEIDDEGLTSPTGTARSDIKEIAVTLPEGMTINPSQAEGLGVCSEADLARETLASQFGEGCPSSSKVGTVQIESQLLEGEILEGTVFVAEPFKNLAGTLIAIYIVIKDPELGILVKQTARVEPDPRTGQLITTAENVPQLPFSHFHFHFREGGRSPLVTPPHCGTFEVSAEFTPWANPAKPFETTSPFQITTGPGGGPCPPGGVPPFEPTFSAGTISNSAGSFSPVHMRLTRKDGDQDMTKFSSSFPPGLLGKLAGLERCPDAALAAAKVKSGKEELAAPSCPASSRIGSTLAGAGVGPALTYVGGTAYLAGPYNGAPLSVAVITPAVAGPFDVGTVVVRVALKLNRVSARAEVDGAASDPIPHILEGIVLKVRDLRVQVDRPNFTLNPTSCRRLSFEATLFGSFLDVFNPADDVPVSLADRFQAADCASLGFKPKLALRLKGGTKRGDHPALRAIVTPRAKDANFAEAVVTLPNSAFLDQAHIRTICTRVQFAAENCPKGSIYGQARATSPLIDGPFKGLVYLRSSNHNLPDLVMALKGPPSAQVEIDLVGRIDSHKGGIRASFESIPDAPVTKFVLDMQGGKKGLIVNSRNLCARPSRATASFSGQNGRSHDFNPLVQAQGCGKKKSAKRRR